MKLTTWIFKIYTASRIDDLYHAYLQEVDFADQVLQELQTVITNEASDMEMQDKI